MLVFIAAHAFSKRFEPYIREQTVEYLSKRFDSDVQLTALDISMPNVSAMKFLMRRGRGTIARVEGEGFSIRHKSNPDFPPIFVMKKVSFDVDLGSLFDSPKIIHSVTIDGMEINIPPREDRKTADLSDNDSDQPDADTDVLVEDVLITNSSLTIFPKDKTKVPLHFDLHNVKLESAGRHVAMKYDANLTNPRPPGEIHSAVNFWPSDS